MKKGCLIAAALIVLAIAGVVGLAFLMTSGAVGAADAFITALAEDRVTDAYGMVAPSRREVLDEAAFRKHIEALGLHKVASAAWSSRSVENDKGKVEGTATTREGNTLPLAIDLVSAGGTWHISDVYLTDGGTRLAQAAPLPSDEVIADLVRETLRSFAAAIATRDFTAFHGEIATTWKQRDTPDELQAAFQDWIDAEADLRGAGEVAPVFDAPPAFNKDGFLAVRGYAPTQPARVHFEMSYTYEHPRWRLMNIGVRMTQP